MYIWTIYVYKSIIHVDLFSVHDFLLIVRVDWIFVLDCKW